MEEPPLQESPPIFEPYPSFWQALAIIGVLVLASIFFAPLITLPIQKEQPGLIFLIYYLATMGVTFWYANRRRQQYSGPGAFSFQAIPFLAWPLLLLSVWGIMILIEPLADLIPMPKEMEKQIQELAGQRDLFTGLAMVVAAPVLEELVFRGIILEGFLRRFPPFHAVLISALLFGIAHLNPWQFLLAGGLGILLGWVYYRSGSLLPCLAIHFFANATGFISRFFLTEEQLLASTRELVGGPTNFLLLLAAAAAVLAGSIWALDKVWGPEDAEY